MDKRVDDRFAAIEKTVKLICDAAITNSKKVTDMRAAFGDDLETRVTTIEDHARDLEEIGDAMEADGIGGHPVRGHAVTLRLMAGNLRAGSYDFNESAPWAPRPIA
jgi:hypothetical protein